MIRAVLFPAHFASFRPRFRPHFCPIAVEMPACQAYRKIEKKKKKRKAKQRRTHCRPLQSGGLRPKIDGSHSTPCSLPECNPRTDPTPLPPPSSTFPTQEHETQHTHRPDCKQEEEEENVVCVRVGDHIQVIASSYTRAVREMPASSSTFLRLQRQRDVSEGAQRIRPDRRSSTQSCPVPSSRR